MIEEPSIFNFDFFISIILCIVSLFITTVLIVGRKEYYKRSKINYIIMLPLYILFSILAITATMFKIFVPSTTCGLCSEPEDYYNQFQPSVNNDAGFDNQK